MSEDTHLPAGGPLHERGTVTSETLQPFDKMQPGEVDKVFRATCPQCDGHVWVFVPKSSGEHFVEAEIDPDARACSNCRYVHWLRGPNESEVIPLRAGSPAGPSKKDRVCALVFAMLASPRGITIEGPMPRREANGNEILQVAIAFDELIEAIK